jgi:uncharacterized membrane-anchored protein YitT (DUF2179 family)
MSAKTLLQKAGRCEMTRQHKDFLIINFATVLFAIETYFFKFPDNFNFGGIGGIAVLASKSGFISAGGITLIVSVLLILTGFLFLGKGFGFKSAYVSIMFAFILIAFEKLFPMSAPLTDEPLLNLVFAVSLQAVCYALLFNIDSSGGGTEVIALILKKYTTIDTSKAMYIVDMIITLLTFLVFDIKTGMLSVLGLTIRLVVLDTFIKSINECKYFNIVCKDLKPICDFIVNEIKRSATVCEAKGAVSNTEKFIVFTGMTKRESEKLKQHMKNNNIEAFTLISNTSEIIGGGFRHI